MPKKTQVLVQLPAFQPDCCQECPLLGLVPEGARIRGSQEVLVCLAKMETMSRRASRVRKSGRDSHHPLRRSCDNSWEAMVLLRADRKYPVSIEQYNVCREPLLRDQSRQLLFKFSNGKITTYGRTGAIDDNANV